MDKTGARLTGAGLAPLLIWCFNDVIGGIVTPLVQHFAPQYHWPAIGPEAAATLGVTMVPLVEHWLHVPPPPSVLTAADFDHLTPAPTP